MTKTITVNKAEKNLSEIVKDVYYGSNDYVISQAGRPIVKLVRICIKKKIKSLPSLESLSLKAKKALKKDNTNLSVVLNNIEKDREKFYKTYLKKHGV